MLRYQGHVVQVIQQSSAAVACKYGGIAKEAYFVRCRIHRTGIELLALVVSVGRSRIEKKAANQHFRSFDQIPLFDGKKCVTIAYKCDEGADAMPNTWAGTVAKVSIEQRITPVFDGLQFGGVGQYEMLTGSADCKIDPEHPDNQSIGNLKFAPRDAQGLVSYRVDLAILKPLDMDRGNGWLLYELVNRGTKRALQRINGGRMSNMPVTREDVGTGFLMNDGFTVVWSGWQGDLVREPGRMRADLPVASMGSAPITRLCREEFILEEKNVVREDINEPIREPVDGVFIAPLHYPALDTGDRSATVTIRARERDARSVPPDLKWRYIDDRHVEITQPAGYDRSAIYEFIYTAKDPIVLGIGLAAIRDIVAFLKTAKQDGSGAANPLLSSKGTLPKRALGFGVSQSGRVLREFTYHGFNKGPEGIKVFDGLLLSVCGARRAVITEPFVQGTRYSRQHEDHLYPGDQFPFTFASLHDPVSGRKDGILDRARADGVVPNVFQIDTDAEMWQARASLVVTDPSGNDIDLDGEARVYLTAGLQHAPFKALSPKIARHPTNLLSYHFLARALIRNLVEWVDAGIAPPPSRFPSRAAGTLVTVEAGRKLFPKIQNVGFPKALNELRLVDHDVQPPAEKGAYPVFICKTDADGNPVDGLLHPLLAAPTGTHTGWQLRNDGYAANELFSVFGAYLAFAETEATRKEIDDPRPSIEARYKSKSEWAAKVMAAADLLVRDRLMLPEDAAALARGVEQSWKPFDVI